MRSKQDESGFCSSFLCASVRWQNMQIMMSSFVRHDLLLIRANSSSSVWSAVLILSISFSDVTFHLFGESESSPFPLISLLVLFVLEQKSLAFVLWWLFGLVLLSIPSFFFLVEPRTILISFAAYLQLALVYWYFYRYGLGSSFLLFRMIVLFHLILGLMQYSGMFELILEAPLSLMLNRANATSLVDIGRGVTFLTVEPSHALQSISFSIFVLSLSENRSDRYLAVLALLLTFFLSMAGQSFIYILVVLFVLIIFNPKFFVPLLILGMAIFPLLSGRAVDAIDGLSNFAVYLDSDALMGMMQLSGFRLPTVVASIDYLFSDPQAFGLGAWQLNILDSLYKFGFNVATLGHWGGQHDIHPVKPYSVFAVLVSDFWWFGFAVYFVFLMKQMSCFSYFRKLSAVSPVAVSMFGLSLFALTVMGTTGKPAFIAVLGLLAHQKAVYLHSLREIKQ